MKADILIRSYTKDFPWLKYCLRSIGKYCHGFRDVIIVVPEQDKAEIQSWGLTREKIFTVNEPKGCDGYLFQQISKVYADKYSDADLIFHVDSDCCFNRNITPDEFIVEGKPFMLITPYSELPPQVPWKPITEKALGFECPFETMRRLPFVFPSILMPDFRRHMETVHGESVESYIIRQPHRAFSEFNAMGAWAHKLCREPFFWWDTTQNQNLPQTVLSQGWSWGGIDSERKKMLEELTA